MKIYEMFGFMVESDVDLFLSEKNNTLNQDLIEDDGDKALPKIRIRMKNRIDEVVLDYDKEWYMDVDMEKGQATIRLREIGYFEISTTEICVYQLMGADENALSLYLLGIGFGTLLLLNRRFSIHGSAVKVKDKAYIICGESGVGKSSLAREFIAKGHEVLSDDVSLIEVINDEVCVVSSYPGQKLWQDTANAFSIDTVDKRPIANRDEKYNISIDEHFFKGKVVVEKVIVISVMDEKYKIGREPRYVDVNGLEVVLNNTYLNDLLELFDMEVEHFRFGANVAKAVQFIGLERPFGEKSTEKQYDMVV